MVRFLDETLPPDVWQACRAWQVKGGPLPTPVPVPRDDMSSPEWRAARAAQVASAPQRLRDFGSPSRPDPDPQRALEGGAERILDLISKGEGTDGPNGYDTTIGYGRYDPKGHGPPTQQSLGEIKGLQGQLRENRAPSTAVGRDQNRGQRTRVGTLELQGELRRAKAEHERFLQTDPYITERIEQGYLPAEKRWR